MFCFSYLIELDVCNQCIRYINTKFQEQYHQAIFGSFSGRHFLPVLLAISVKSGRNRVWKKDPTLESRKHPTLDPIRSDPILSDPTATNKEDPTQPLIDDTSDQTTDPTLNPTSDFTRSKRLIRLYIQPAILPQLFNSNRSTQQLLQQPIQPNPTQPNPITEPTVDPTVEPSILLDPR